MERYEEGDAYHRSEKDKPDRAASSLVFGAGVHRSEDHGDGEAAQGQQLLVRPDERAARRTSKDQPITAAALGEDPGTSVGGDAEQEGHERFLADIRGPKDQSGKEEEQISVPMTARPTEREGKGAVKVNDADEGKEAENQEASGLVDSDNGEDHPGDNAHRPVGDDSSEMGRREREVQGVESGDQQCSLGVVPVVVRDAPVEVVYHPDLQRGADQVKKQTNREHLAEPRITLGQCGTPDDDASDSEQGNRYNNYRYRLRRYLSIGHEESSARTAQASRDAWSARGSPSAGDPLSRVPAGMTVSGSVIGTCF